MKDTLCVVIGVCATFGIVAAASGNVIEFDEVSPLPANLSSLVGSNSFAAEGLTFAGQTDFVADQRFVGAGTDAYGIATAGSTGTTAPTAVVNFATPLTSLTIDGLSVGTDFVADVYHGNTLLDTFTGAGTSGTTYFSHTFVGNITRLDFHDHGGYVGVGRLTFVLDPPVPEPQAGMMIPLLGMLTLIRRPGRLTLL